MEAAKMKFELSDDQIARARAWISERKSKMLAEQIEACAVCDEDDLCVLHCCGPYHGAIGGGTSFSFTPTSMGMIAKVVYNGDTLDLSDYDKW